MRVHRWCDLLPAERTWVVRAIRAGAEGDLLMPDGTGNGRWYRIIPRW